MGLRGLLILKEFNPRRADTGKRGRGVFWYRSGTKEKAAITFVITACISEPPIGIEPMTY
jgi:hypothetical protein